MRFRAALTVAIMVTAAATMCVYARGVLYGSGQAPLQVSGIVTDRDCEPLDGVRVSAFKDVLVGGRGAG